MCHMKTQETPQCLFLFAIFVFSLALSSSVTVGGDRAVFSGIMQIVTSAVRFFAHVVIFLCDLLVKRMSLFLTVSWQACLAK